MTVLSGGAWCLSSCCASVSGAVVFHITAMRQLWSWISVSGVQVGSGSSAEWTIFGVSCCSVETTARGWGHIFLFKCFSLCGLDWMGFKQQCCIPLRNFSWWVFSNFLPKTKQFCLAFSDIHQNLKQSYFKTMTHTFYILHLHASCSCSHLILCFTTSQMS